MTIARKILESLRDTSSRSPTTPLNQHNVAPRDSPTAFYTAN
jgi:hypothetical protein